MCDMVKDGHPNLFVVGFLLHPFTGHMSYSLLQESLADHL